nr:diacylglycerol kinase family protein [Conexibacter arvalis]
MARDRLVEEAVAVAALAAALALARRSFAGRARLPPRAAPRRPVLFFNPKSGGGKAARFALADEARARSIEPIELHPGDDLERLVRDAVAAGADALAMAGGDGSQAIVAAVAAEHDLPYACVPAGTRNHFALDLGVDRDDVVGALDAFVDGGERRVDLAEVNGRVFVNNVSLGLYAEAVQRGGYRDAKLRTLLDTIPATIGPDGAGLDLRWRGPGGTEHRAGAAILVSNNRYRLGRAIGSGTRPRIDDGLLGVTVVGRSIGRGGEGRLPQRPWREWSAPAFDVDADHVIPAGIDGEAARLHPPLRFRIRAGVLRVRVSRRHPGASPSAAMPEGLREGARALARIAAGRDDRHGGDASPDQPPPTKERRWRSSKSK